jgi:hypothetical protein
MAPTATAGAYNGGGGAYDSNGYYYDPCRRSTTQRGTGGGLAGAGIGAAIGSGVAAKGARTEGAVLGGLHRRHRRFGHRPQLGGLHAGRQSAPSASVLQSGRLQPALRQSRPRGSTIRPTSDSRYGDRRDGYTYESERSYSVTDKIRLDANGCTLAESPIYLPDGRVQKRFVRVCPDAQGRYQVVD